MKRLCLSIALAVVAILLIVAPVLAAYYAYIYIEESSGNSYDDLPLVCAVNTTPLIQGGFMSSTGLDTRVLTGSGEALPHMMADDKIMFVTDLAAYEDKTLIFYLGATSLSSFPIVVGYNGSFTTPDDPDLELGYVMELLIVGYFNADTDDVGHNYLYKEGAIRVWPSATNTLKVAAYNATGAEQWFMSYSSFTTGYHSVYIVCNGLGAYLYVDDFVTAKDTENLFESANYEMVAVGSSSALCPMRRNSFYASGLYWAFYTKGGTADIYYRTSVDGSTWAAEQALNISYNNGGFGVWGRNDYVHITYGTSRGSGVADFVYYRRGYANVTGNITWDTGWQIAETPPDNAYVSIEAGIAVDSAGYPFIIYGSSLDVTDYTFITKSSTNNGTWTTAGGYPITVDTTTPYMHRESITAYYNSTKMYMLWTDDNVVDQNVFLKGKYYNGSTWEGSATTIYNADPATISNFNAISDADDNLYVYWSRSSGNNLLVIRYSDGTWSDPIAIGSGSHSTSFNPSSGYVYFFCKSGNDVIAYVLAEGEISTAYVLASPGSGPIVSTPYSDHIGIMFSKASSTQHIYLVYPWEWVDNANNWTWMMNNSMSYVEDIIMAVDGTEVLEYEPASIIQGTTLPDETSDHDGIITWGANPAGINVTMSALQLEQSYNQTYYYQYLQPGTQDIIKPEPANLVGDVDLERLQDNPLYPLVQVLSIDGFMNERLVWLGLAWAIVILAMLGVHLGFDTRKGTEKPQHFILTTITGLGLSILFYSWGIFALWVVVLMSFGLVAAIIWERQPVI